MAAIFIISNIVGEGIYEKGIYYNHGRRTLVRLAKWEEIEDIKIDMNKNQLEIFTNTKIRQRIYPNQYYKLEDIIKIKKFLED